MAFDPKIVATLMFDAKTKQVLDYVVRSKRIQFRDLLKRMEPDTNQESAKNALATLKQAGLVGERQSMIEDLSTFYITADGLEASRQLESARRKM